MSATKDALSITEVLQEILQHLPTKDLIFAQQVCKVWRHLIHVRPFPGIRRKLFQEPEPVQSIWTAGKLTVAKLASSRSSYHWEIFRKLQPADILLESPAAPERDYVANKTITAVSLNPFLTRLPSSTFLQTYDEPAFFKSRIEIGERVSIDIDHARGIPTYQNMLLTQPPCKHAVIVVSNAYVAPKRMWMDVPSTHFKIDVSNAEGIRIQDVVEAVSHRLDGDTTKTQLVDLTFSDITIV